MAKAKDLKVVIPQEKVMYTSISKSSDGYSSARVVAKMGEKEYMSVTYEWEGIGVPGFAMDLMQFMQATASKSGDVVAGFEEDYEDYAAKSKDGTKKVPGDTTKKKSPKVCDNCGNAVDDCTCDGNKQKKKTKEKKGKDKKA